MFLIQTLNGIDKMLIKGTIELSIFLGAFLFAHIFHPSEKK